MIPPSSPLTKPLLEHDVVQGESFDKMVDLSKDPNIMNLDHENVMSLILLKCSEEIEEINLYIYEYLVFEWWFPL